MISFLASTTQTLNNSLADATFWIGLVSVFLFAHSRFDISLPGTDEMSPPIVPRSFTTRFRYHLAGFTYVGLFVFIYFGLLLVGCFPFLQEVLKAWFGSLDAGGKSIGSPAWAALAATTLLPSAPGFGTVDEKIRQALQDFASIPAKARLIAKEIVGSIPVDHQTTERASDDDLRGIVDDVIYHKNRFEVIRRLWTKLANIDDVRAARRYNNFFHNTKKVVDSLEGDFKISPSELSSIETARYVEE